MKNRTLIYAAILVGGIATATTGAAYARPMHGCSEGHQGWHGASYGHDHWRGGFMPHLKLTQEQRDEMFKIFYAEAPAVREKRIALRHDQKALAAAAMTDHYDPHRVQELASAEARTQSELIMLRNRALNRAYRVLTPSQQAEVVRWRQTHGAD
ncbi:MAG: Spy/CpxP family protein refolding chaperone [Acidiferrobacterales bacterium]